MDEFHKLYKDNYKKVYFYLRNICRDERLADDLTQDTFYNILTHICAGRKFEVCGKWFIKVAHNVFIDYVRKNKISLDSLEILGNEPVAPASDLSLKLDLLNMLNSLPVRYKSIILLRDYYGFSYEEISEIMDCTVSTVKAVLFRARKKFKEVYEDYDR